MTNSKQSLIALTVAYLASIITLAPTTSALADFEVVEGYYVDPGRTTNATDHGNAVYMVYQSSPPPNKQSGIFFMQTQGSYPFMPFVCTDGVFDPPSQSVSCSKISSIPGLELRETVTVGRLPNAFCESLRDKYNSDPGEEDNPILEPAECTGAGKCSCYEVKHECRAHAGHEWDEALCPELASVFGEGNRTTGDKGHAPPGRGAGSGVSN